MHSEKAPQIATNFIPPHPLKTAVLLLVFNRPDTTKQVFEAIRKAKPPMLYVAADGARADMPDETEKVEEVRKIATQVDWDCEVKTLFRDDNLGCKVAVSSAIDWFFENEEEGIILEDDCLPSQSFFWFCQELLEKYRNDTRIMHIAGSTYVEKKDNFNHYSYHFARVGGIWGWATWRRAWKLYEPEMESWPQAKNDNIMKDLFIGELELYKLYNSWFKMAYQNNYTWDYQWTYTKIIHSSLNIMPCKNLIRNIGHGTTEAANTHSKNDRFSKMKLHEIEFPLIHPQFIVIDKKFNYQNFKYATYEHVIIKVARKIVSVLPSKLVSLIKHILFKGKEHI